MKSTCTAVVLAFALLAMHVVAHEPTPGRRDMHSHAAALLDGALHAYWLAKRGEGSGVVQRADEARPHLAALPAAIDLASPDQFEIITTARASSALQSRPLIRVQARAPPLS